MNKTESQFSRVSAAAPGSRGKSPADAGDCHGSSRNTVFRRFASGASRCKSRPGSRGRAAAAVLFAACFVLLAVLLGQAVPFRAVTSAFSDEIQSVSQMYAVVGLPAPGDEATVGQQVALPYAFTELPARTPVTLTGSLNLREGDCLYLKSVYAPMKAYINEALVYECGQPDSYPAFMRDPATTVAIVPLGDASGAVELRLEYLSPVSRSTLSVQSVLVGRDSALLGHLLSVMGFSFVFSLIQILFGLMLSVTALCVLVAERRAIAFLWLGLFSLTTGLWVFGECNLTGLFIPNPTLLYLLDFLGLFSFVIPLLLFGLSVVRFHDKRLLRAAVFVNLIALTGALALQLAGLVAMSKSMYLFHLLAPGSLLLFAVCIFREGLHYQTPSARRFFLPMAVLAAGALLELLNYQLRFTDMLSILFQLGVIVFVILMGIVGGLFLRDAIRLKSEKQRLQFEVRLMEQGIEEQKKRQQLLMENVEAVRAQRHDLRHHLAVLRGLSRNAENRQLSDYLDALTARIPAGPEEDYCENAAVNAVVSYYATAAKREGVRLDIRLTVPAGGGISDSSLCVIFGNLLENALEACRGMGSGEPFDTASACEPTRTAPAAARQEAAPGSATEKRHLCADDEVPRPDAADTRRFIRLKSRLQFETLTIVMDNSFNGKWSRDEAGLISGKRGTHGIGTASILAVAEENGGSACFEADGSVFKSSVYVQIS